VQVSSASNALFSVSLRLVKYMLVKFFSSFLCSVGLFCLCSYFPLCMILYFIVGHMSLLFGAQVMNSNSELYADLKNAEYKLVFYRWTKCVHAFSFDVLGSATVTASGAVPPQQAVFKKFCKSICLTAKLLRIYTPIKCLFLLKSCELKSDVTPS